VPPEQRELVRRWLAAAEGDWRVAHALLTSMAEPVFEAVCFHAQQCAEKYVKAILVAHAIDFPKTHDMARLRQLMPAGLALPLSERETDLLTDYAVETRYPEDGPDLDRAASHEAIHLADRVRNAVLALHLERL